MDALFVRVDERLLHGQVTLGWASSLQPQVLLLANDRFAEDPVQRRLYAEMRTDDFMVRIEDVDAAGRFLQENPQAATQTLVVVETAADARALRHAGAPVMHVNLGGLYQQQGRRRLVDYVWLSDADIDSLQSLVQEGVEVEARDVPSTPALAVDAMTLERIRHKV